MNAIFSLILLALLVCPFRAATQTTVADGSVLPSKLPDHSVVSVVMEGRAVGATLKGKLMLPAGAGPHPAVVLQSGLGAGDRVVGEHLARVGIAVLEVEEPLISRGFWTPNAFAEDALVAVRWLKVHSKIDPKKIGLIGHSQRGVAATMAAGDQPADIAFVVLLAAIGVPVEEWHVRQISDQTRAVGADEDLLAKIVALWRELIPRVIAATDPEQAKKIAHEIVTRHFAGFTAEQREAHGLDEKMAKQIEETIASSAFREYLTFDPRPFFRRVKCPVLALNGSLDLQVSAKDNLVAIAASLKMGGNERVKTVEFPGLDHFFQTVPPRGGEAKSPLAESISPAVLKAVSDWIAEQTRR